MINNMIERIRKYYKTGFEYVKVDRESLKIGVYWDGYFMTNMDGTSQVGYLLFMAHRKSRDSLIENESNK